MMRHWTCIRNHTQKIPLNLLLAEEHPINLQFGLVPVQNAYSFPELFWLLNNRWNVSFCIPDSSSRRIMFIKKEGWESEKYSYFSLIILNEYMSRFLSIWDLDLFLLGKHNVKVLANGLLWEAFFIFSRLLKTWYFLLFNYASVDLLSYTIISSVIWYHICRYSFVHACLSTHDVFIFFPCLIA